MFSNGTTTNPPFSSTAEISAEDAESSIIISEEGEVTDDAETQPIFEVKFRSKTDFDKWSEKIVNALGGVLNSVPEKCVISLLEEEQSIQAFLANVPENQNTELETSINNEEEPQSDVKNDSSLFMIDTAPAVVLDKAQVPSYKRTIKDMLNESTECKKPKNDLDKCSRPSRATSECFNCGSKDHEIRLCPKPRNNTRINRAKKLFASKQERYHIDIEQRFAHLRPGVISKQLQSALGMRSGEIPFFFYRMRVLGYPPGWLEDAKVSHSGIALFNSDGAEVLHSDDDGQGNGVANKYNSSRIIDFPGFNASPGETFYDDFKHHNVPPINPQDMKQEYIKTLGINKFITGYKRKKLKDLPTVDIFADNENTFAVQVADMELEDEAELEKSIDPGAQFKSPKEPPQALNDSSVLLSDSTKERSPSPTLADLESQQQQLLLQLKADTSTNLDSSTDEVSVQETTQINLEEQSSQHNVSDAHGEVLCTSTPSTPIASKSNQFELIQASHMGTPILHFSPFEKLPDGDNFKVGVSDVINFENLPDSTGKYEQMKVVIKKVRNIITQMQSEDD